ncbi:NAD(P)-dependent oxidoreductase [Phaeobacter gallaeciensis]|uniref:NAD(P)-dependent oxidoreductase n=2 Tax=Roseobacteraceae TaxID=2854170 RepID=A0A366X7Q5_9RHOB|nr:MULTISPECIES: NAD(P)-dependent oxidoreductase [Roseobacteraceae]MBT3142307.1 NAD(P)-dependent oxidoreductase [Falsiruegeria litorea]MBT8168138.1 NAD(P)-dependent oxidoreductase [Falsiruegeria litorea]RBW61095.1 NAD(P)-dependent oxidoreductase [Phaeobacter gallaeciensis]
MKKIVLTGAAGRLGSYLREPLSKLCEEFVSSDIADAVSNLAPNETYVKADITDLDAMVALLQGADMVVHFGAVGDEAPMEVLWGPNFYGAYTVWEAAYRNKLRRVVYASSIHAVGMHKKTDFIGTDAPHKPDTFYGLAKCFAEDLASLYWDKRGLESVCMRILSCAQPTNSRAVGTWLSYDDLIHMVERAISTPITGFSVVYGVSNNDRVPVDNAKAQHLGYCPKDNAEQFAEQLYTNDGPLDPLDPANTHQGGPFAAVELGQSGMAHLNLNVDDTAKD